MKMRLQINHKNTVEMDEQILELTRDENGRITGSIGGDRIHFYSNVMKMELLLKKKLQN